MSLKESVKHLLRMCGHAMVSTVHDRLNVLEDEVKELASSQTALLQSSIHIVETLPELQQAYCLESVDSSAETGLMSFLISFLPTRRVVDVGPQKEDGIERLLRTGFEIYAIDPPAKSAALRARIAPHPAFHTIEAELNGARTLGDLHREKMVPEDVSLVKVSAQGHELEILYGMRGRNYAAVAADFRESSAVSKTGGNLGGLITHMRSQGYPWFIVLYRTSGQSLTSFFCNQDVPVAGSWGHVFFFQDRELFAHAQEWCASALPRTYFKPANL